MIEKQRYIAEMYDLKHIHDEATVKPFDYRSNLYQKTMSPPVLANPTTMEFLMKLQKCSVWMIDSVLFVRNFFDYSVDKYYDRHNS